MNTHPVEHHEMLLNDYTQDASKCYVLGDLIFLAIKLLKVSNSWLYCELLKVL